MIVDLILDRKDNEEWYGKDLYSGLDFYHEVCDYSGAAMGRLTISHLRWITARKTT